MTDNKADVPNPAMALQFQFGRHWRAVGEPRHWATTLTDQRCLVS